MNRNITIQLKQYAQHTRGSGDTFGAHDIQQVYQYAGGDIYKAISTALEYGYAVGFRQHWRKSEARKKRSLRSAGDGFSDACPYDSSCKEHDGPEGDLSYDS